MKHNFLSILGILILTCNFAFANSEEMFYYAGNEKCQLTLISHKRALLRPSTEKKESYVERIGARLQIETVEKSSNEILEFDSIGKLSLPVFSINNEFEAVLLPEVILHPKDSTRDVSRLCEEFHLTLRKSTSLYQIYSLPLDSDVISIANILYESGYFDFAYPNLFCPAEKFAYIPNDPYFQFQIACHNTGQTMYNGHTGSVDADINGPEAWDITKGSWNVVVAVFDDGVTAEHPDLPSWRQCRYNGSNFGSGNVNDPSPVGNDNHGNACAGVIGATMDNEAGIAGIAPQCRILPIRWDATSSPDDMADGILFAVNHGANIISCSWGYNSSSTILYPVIKNAIDTAIAHNVIVLFAAGNTANHVVDNDGYVCFPANADAPNLITVGASDRYDYMANYSPISWQIDFVAPSHRAYANQISGESFEMWSIDVPGPYGSNPIPSNLADGVLIEGTCIPNSGLGYLAYTGCFGGTSHACPVVAGVVALMLSVNPDLTPSEVYDILKVSSAKVGGYTYTDGRSDEMGYGRVDAYAAVTAAQTLADLKNIEIEGSAYFCDSSYYYVRNVPDGALINWSISSLSYIGPRILGDTNKDSVLLGNLHVNPPFPIYDSLIIKGQNPYSLQDTNLVKSPMDRKGKLSVTVSKGGLSYTKTKTLFRIQIGKPEITVSDPQTNWPLFTPKTFTVTNCTEVADESIEWTVTQRFLYDTTLVYQSTGRSLTYTPYGFGNFDVTACNKDMQCGSTSTTKTYYVTFQKGRENTTKRATSNINTPSSEQNENYKFIEDGQLYIKKGDNIYTIQGVLKK